MASQEENRQRKALNLPGAETQSSESRVTLNQKTSDVPGSDSALSGPTHDGPTLNRPTKGAEVDNNITQEKKYDNMV